MSNPSNPWAWLGLLRWSLTYSDGTRPSDLSPMSKDDREFLEKVMREGIIDEDERMKVILQQVADCMEEWKQDGTVKSTETEENVEQLLQELRDIVEQIDYARAFAALKGIDFLLGCIQEASIPSSVRSECCGIIATMAQHNPPVQKEMLEAGALKTLSDLYFESPQDRRFQARLIQAMSAIVRQNTLAEAVFCKLEQSVSLFETALHKDGNQVVQTRALFFLSALLTSDDSDKERTQLFDSILTLVETEYLENYMSLETREMSLALVTQLTERGLLHIDTERKSYLAAVAMSRIHALRNMSSADAVTYAVELDQWEHLLRSLAT